MDHPSFQPSVDAQADVLTLQRKKSGIPRVGVVGAGGFGSRHAGILSLLAKEGYCELVAACDPRLESLPKAWSENPLSQVQLFRDHEQMFQASALDYVVIASPPQWHEEHCLRALETEAFIYLEKPPVPTFSQLRNLLSHSGADRIAVGFQMLEAKAIRDFKQKLVGGGLGTIREICATALWPRPTSYYERASWAGKLVLDGRPVFDGPLTNALSHLVQNVFFLAGDKAGNCALPETVASSFLRAQPIASYDFGWIKGKTDNGISYNILAGHCSRKAIPWQVSIRTDRGIYSVGETDIPSVDDSLLAESHRTSLAARSGNGRITSRLSDCMGYSMATSAAWFSSPSVITIPSSEIVIEGSGAESICHVEAIYQLVDNFRAGRSLLPPNPAWLSCGPEVDCCNALMINK